MIKVDANGVQASKTFEALEKQMKGMSKSLANIGKSMSLYVTAPLTALAAVSVKNADTQQQAEAKLLTALRGREDIQQRLIKSAAALQGRSTLGDEAIIAQQAFLASLGLTEQQINDTIEAAAQLSYATGMQLESAVKNLAKTYGGLAGELGESIPAMKQFTKEQMQQGAAVKFVNDNYKGFAETAAATGSGPLKQLKNQFGDLLEQVGNILIPVMNKLVNALKTVTSWFQNLSPSAQSAIVTIGAIAAGLGPVVLAFSKLVSLVPAIVTGIRNIGAAFSVASLSIGVIVAALGTLLAKIFEVDAAAKRLREMVEKEWTEEKTAVKRGTIEEYSRPVYSDEDVQERLKTVNEEIARLQNIKTFDTVVSSQLVRYRAEAEGLMEVVETRRRAAEDAAAQADRANQKTREADGLIGQLEAKIKKLNDSLPWLKSRDQIIEVQRQIAILQAQLDDIESSYENISTAITVDAEIDKSALTAAPTLAAGDMSEYNRLKPTIDWSSKSDIDSMNKWTADIVDASASISSTVGKVVEDMAVTIGEGLGDMLSGGAWNPIGAIMALIGAALKELGKQLIKIAGIGKMIQEALKKVIVAPWLALAAGVAAIALGQMIQNLSAKPLALAEGGLAFGPTLALIGDNRGAASDPEVVAPLSKLRNIIDTSSSRISFDGAEFIISGDALRAVLRREDMRVAALG